MPDRQPPTSDDTRPKRADARRNESSVLEAASAVFVASGVQAPIREIAAKAGVGTATIYRHFAGGRDQLLRDAITREVGRFWADLAAEVAGIESLEGRLVAGIMSANRRIADHRLLTEHAG